MDDLDWFRGSMDWKPTETSTILHGAEVSLDALLKPIRWMALHHLNIVFDEVTTPKGREHHVHHQAAKKGDASRNIHWGEMHRGANMALHHLIQAAIECKPSAVENKPRRSHLPETCQMMSTAELKRCKWLKLHGSHRKATVSRWSDLVIRIDSDRYECQIYSQIHVVCT